MEIDEIMQFLDVKGNEIEKAKYYFEMKGVDLHFSILEYLSSFTPTRIKYCELATVFRYDKRIRKTLYKYIGLFEEHIRAYISNKYSSNLGQITLVGRLEKSLIKEKTLFRVLDKALFADLMQQVFQLCCQDKERLFPETKYDEGNLKSIIELRNAVCHNRFLLNYRDFRVCNINGEKKASLYACLVVFASFLPPDIRMSFVEEIEHCKERRDNKNDIMQTTWSLPPMVMIKLREERWLFSK